ncbi:ParB/RepB/Spo0J family partition protein [Saccharothrix sp. HUAS TT1]|uniref:ParB/RepB/Spo0J family partition protein n=1 Tax=unclassified Saccharothrix TaxID=2593673 RepID=UPI00345B7FA3
MAGLLDKAKEKKDLRRANDAGVDPARLTPDAAVSSTVPGARLMMIPLGDIAYNPRNARDEDIEDDPRTVELAKSIALITQQQPAVVVPREVFLERWPDERISKLWVVMAGNRRRAANKLNGTPEMECIVRDRITSEMLEDIPIHENVHRKDLDSLRLAYWLAEKVKELGNERKVAEAVGKSQPWVNHLLKLLQLIPELQAEIKGERLSAKQGRFLARLPREEQEEVWLRAAALPEEKRSDFWSGGAWKADNPVIGATPVAATAPLRPDVPAGAGATADPLAPPAGSGAATDLGDAERTDEVSGVGEDEPPREQEPAKPERARAPKPAIVIRIEERDTVALAEALRSHLDDVEFTELVQAMQQLS